MNTNNNPFLGNQNFPQSQQNRLQSVHHTQQQYIQDEDDMEGVELEPSETSLDQHQFSNNENVSTQQPMPINTPPVPHNQFQQHQQQQQQIVFPPRQVQGGLTGNNGMGNQSISGNNRYSNISQYQQQQQIKSDQANNVNNISQSLLNLSDSALQEHNTTNNNNTSSNPGYQQQQPSALVRQLSDKVRTQAERLQKLETYKQLCEKRILDLDPKHQLPVLPQHLGLKPQSQNQSQPNDQSQSNLVDMKRTLAIKEQDLTYTKQRNEKLQQEVETLKKQLIELDKQVFSTGNAGNSSQQSHSQNQSISLQNNAQVAQVEEALRREIQINEQLSRKLQILNQGNFLEKIKDLEDEKNALLDYIEENVEKSQRSEKPYNTLSTAAVIQDQDRFKQLESEKSKLYQLTESLKYNEALARQKLLDLEEDFKVKEQEMNNVRSDLSELQKRYNLKCEENIQLVKQFDPNYQENTFGNIEDLQQRIQDFGTLQKELDFNKEQFESTKVSLKKEKEHLSRMLEQADDKIQSLEDKLRESDQEKSRLLDRIQRQDGESEHLDELMHENDNLKREQEKLNTKCRMLQENSSTLSQTLNETQQELESLLNEHESLAEDYKKIKSSVSKQDEELNKYKSLLRDNELESAKLRTESIDLRKETTRQREELTQKRAEVANLNDLLYKSEAESRELRGRVLEIERELQYLQQQERDRNDKQLREFEATFEDLTRELKNVQGELTEKEHIFQRVEQELKQKLNMMEEVNHEKTDLKRRLDDLQSEVKHLQTLKFEKEEKLKLQIHKNEELLEQLERMNMIVNQAKEEKEMTLQVKNEKDRDLDKVERKYSKTRKQVERIFKNVKSVQKLVNDYNNEFKIKNGEQIKLSKAQNSDSSPNTSHQNENQFEQLLLDCDQVLFQLIDWFSHLTLFQRNLTKNNQDIKSELLLAQQRVSQIDQKYKSTSQEELELREKERFLSTEVENLRDKLKMKDEEKKDSYTREERIQRQNQQIKEQLENCRKEQEKLLMQIKSLLAEKERLIDESKQTKESQENENERLKSLEVKLSQVFTQKEELVRMIERVKDAMPSQTLQEILGDIIQTTVYDQFRLQEEMYQCENELMSMEGELRQYAKKKQTEVNNQGGVGLLNAKAINLRKEVEKRRDQLREINEQRDQILKKRDQLELELRSVESSERRRNNVALETEKSLTETKYELSQLKKELIFTNNNRKDLEVALQSVQEEKKMIERELLSLRAQLQIKANGGTVGLGSMSVSANQSIQMQTQPNHQQSIGKQSTIFNILGAQSQGSQIQGTQVLEQQVQQPAFGSLRHGELLFQQNTNSYIGDNNHAGGLIAYTEKIQPPLASQNLPLRERFSSLEKNKRTFIAQQQDNINNSSSIIKGGQNIYSARGALNERADDVENIEPNRSIDYRNQQQQNHGLNHYKSLTSLDQPLQMQQQQQHQVLYSRPPIAQSHNVNSNFNTFKRSALSNRAGSVQKMPSTGLGLGTNNESLQENEVLDENEFPIRTSLQKRLSQVKNVFSAIRKNLQEQSQDSYQGGEPANLNNIGTGGSRGVSSGAVNRSLGAMAGDDNYTQ